MSALGHKRTWPHVRSMSALPLKADIQESPRMDQQRVDAASSDHEKSPSRLPHCSVDKRFMNSRAQSDCSHK
jgi:hypothetical protein